MFSLSPNMLCIFCLTYRFYIKNRKKEPSKNELAVPARSGIIFILPAEVEHI